MESKHIIINVGRQVCAGGLEIGRLLAEEFHAKYYDRELLNLAARESGFSEEFLKRSDERKGFFRTILHLPGASTMDGDSFYQNNFSQESLFKFQSEPPRSRRASLWAAVPTMCCATSPTWSIFSSPPRSKPVQPSS